MLISRFISFGITPLLCWCQHITPTSKRFIVWSLCPAAAGFCIFSIGLVGSESLALGQRIFLPPIGVVGQLFHQVPVVSYWLVGSASLALGQRSILMLSRAFGQHRVQLGKRHPLSSDAFSWQARPIIRSSIPWCAVAWFGWLFNQAQPASHFC